MSGSTEMVKVELRGPDGDVETLWATRVGPERFQLENSPFFAYGVSWLDVIEARPEYADRFPVFVRVVEKSGHRTVRIILDAPADESEESQRVLDELETLGCSIEGYNATYIAVDVPPDVQLASVVEFLIASSVQWEYADPTYDEIHGPDS